MGRPFAGTRRQWSLGTKLYHSPCFHPYEIGIADRALQGADEFRGVAL